MAADSEAHAGPDRSDDDGQRDYCGQVRQSPYCDGEETVAVCGRTARHSLQRETEANRDTKAAEDRQGETNLEHKSALDLHAVTVGAGDVEGNFPVGSRFEGFMNAPPPPTPRPALCTLRRRWVVLPSVYKGGDDQDRTGVISLED